MTFRASHLSGAKTNPVLPTNHLANTGKQNLTATKLKQETN